jgi:hypothetical protein
MRLLPASAHWAAKVFYTLLRGIKTDILNHTTHKPDLLTKKLFLAKKRGSPAATPFQKFYLAQQSHYSSYLTKTQYYNVVASIGGEYENHDQ